MTSNASIEDNLNRIETLVKQSCSTRDNAIVVLPECATLFACSGKQMLMASEVLDNGPIQIRLAKLAKTTNTILVAGSMPISCPESEITDSKTNNKYYACSIIYGQDGKRIATYNKIHLFDVTVEDGTGTYEESKYTERGTALSVVDLRWAKLGQSICYDLRFPRLYAAMNFPEIIVVPSAFTKVTGQAHWHSLLKARAIENQAYVIAANQWGQHDDGRETYGNSCIYSPWGELMSVLEEGCGAAIADYDEKSLLKVRRAMPVSVHSQALSLAGTVKD